jgi:rubrerythrin
MELEDILDRCHGLEDRAAAVYRRFASVSRSQPKVCALWTRLAREEEEHARSVAIARAELRMQGSSRTSVHGWAEALAEIEARLEIAEQLPAGATTAEQLAAALDVEMTELDALRHALLKTADASPSEHQAGHAEGLADAAETLTDDPQVRLQVALLRARARLKHP